MDNNSYLLCNNFVNNWNGMYFNGTTIGDQLPGSTAQQNQWTGTVSAPLSQMAGNIVSTINFWWMGSGTYNPNPNPAIVGGSFVTNAPQFTSNPNDDCPYFLPPPPPTPAAQRTQYFEKVVLNQMNYSQDSLENTYWGMQDAFRYFKQNPSMLSLGESDDSIYVNFYNSVQNTPMGQFEEVFRLIGDSDITGAVTLNASIAASSTMDVNRKTVNGIYFRSWAVDSTSFLPADSSTLLSIALQNPFTGGDAVYSARVMLGIDPQDAGSRFQQNNSSTEEQSSIVNPSCKIYPVPAKDELIIELPIAEGIKAKMEIYSAMGVKVASYDFNQKQNLHQINIANLGSGVYMCHILLNDETIHSGRIIVIK
jgi:hypothetical protein